jgi:hypothetical protein
MLKFGVSIGLVFFFMVGIISCGSNELVEGQGHFNEDKSNKELTEDVNRGGMTETDQLIVDLKKVQFFMPEEVKVLQKYTSDSVIFFIDLGIVNYFELNSDTAFLSNLIELSSLMKQFILDVQNSPSPPYQTKGLYYTEEIDEEFGFLQYAIPFFLNTCVAECTVYSAAWNTLEIRDRVKKTNGTLDDEFVELLFLAHGEFMGIDHGFLSWFNQTWDYGGSSFLGDKRMYDFLKKAKQFESKTELGQELFNFYRQDILNVALYGCYEKTAIQILEEIKLITNEQLLNEEATVLLKKLAEIIKSGNASCPFCHFKNLQLNCEENECNYGG